MSLAEYLNQYKKIASSSLSRTLRIALLTSFTTRGSKETLAVKCAQFGLQAALYEAPYNNYQQEILDEASALYKFAPELIFLFIDRESLFGEAKVDPGFIEEKVDELIYLVNLLKKRTRATIVLHNLEVPTYSPLGIQESRERYGLIEATEELNRKLREHLKGINGAFLFDYNGFASEVGKERLRDWKMYYLADMKLDLNLIPELMERYLAYILPAAQASRKCIVLDLDQTLWGGIIGEDGLANIALGPTPEGSPFWEFQKGLKKLYERGIILAINSLNNAGDAMKAIEEHPYMVLRKDNFAAMQINWKDKVSNMRALSQELNLGLDSFVFFDNDPLQREMVRSGLPEVLVVDMPEDPALYVPTLERLSCFNTLQLTEEDRTRGVLYSSLKKAKAAATNMEEFLKGLEMQVTIEAASPQTIPRIAQLTQKTNQFNMATRRYTEEEIGMMAQSDNFRVLSFRVRDRFGEHGLVGVLILKKEKDDCLIDTFLLSCRVIGREVENQMLAHAIEEARRMKAKRLVTQLIPTEKNLPAQEFFKKQPTTFEIEKR